MTSQHVILCEGYNDRSFWAGWLQHRGLRKSSADPWGRPVTGGQFGYATRSGAFTRLVSCDGGENVARTAKQFINGQPTHPIDRLLVNLDADDTLAARSTRAHDIIRRIATEAGGSPDLDGDGAYTAQGIKICPIIWTCADADAPGIPDQQALERLVTASIVAAYPERGPDVHRWLLADPRGPATHKNYAMSYYAKWFAQDRGPDDFYRALWRDTRVVAELERCLRATGAWALVERLVGP